VRKPEWKYFTSLSWMNEEVKSIYMICNTIIVLANFLFVIYAVLKVHIFTVSRKKTFDKKYIYLIQYLNVFFFI